MLLSSILRTHMQQEKPKKRKKTTFGIPLTTSLELSMGSKIFNFGLWDKKFLLSQTAALSTVFCLFYQTWK